MTILIVFIYISNFFEMSQIIFETIWKNSEFFKIKISFNCTVLLESSEIDTSYFYIAIDFQIWLIELDCSFLAE